MTDGDFTRHERELGVLASGYAELKEDVGAVAEEVRKIRTETVRELSDSEKRVNAHLDQRVGELEKRIERMIATGRWAIGVSVPVICVLIGILVGQS